jgi:hypothetical protein
MNNISTETVSVTLVSEHCMKPAGLDFPSFLSLRLLGLFCQKSLNKNCQVQELQEHNFINICSSQMKHTAVHIPVTIHKYPAGWYSILPVSYSLHFVTLNCSLLQSTHY